MTTDPVVRALRSAALVLAAPRKRKTTAPPPAREPPGKMFHVTTPEAAASIMEHGFRLGFVRHGRDMGPGVYGTPNREYAEGALAKRFRERFGAGAAMLEVKIPTKLLEIDHFGSWVDVYHACAGGREAGNARFDADNPSRRNKSPEQVWETVLQPMIKAAGYLGVLETGHPSTANVCVFDPADVKPLVIVQALSASAADSPAHRVAVSLLIDAPDLSLDEAVDLVRTAQDDLYDVESHEMVPAKDVLRELTKLIPTGPVAGEIAVYHATDASTARLLLRRGFIPETKPRPRAGMDYAPGRGIDIGLYVGGSPKDVESYGRETLEVMVPKRYLEVPTELAQLGMKNAMEALRSHDGAVINHRLPASAFRLLER